MKSKKISLFFLYFLSLFYFEILFKVLAVPHFFNHSWIYIFFYDAFLSFLLTILSSFGKEKINRFLFYLILFLFTVWSCAEVVFKNSFHVYFSLATTFFADQAVSFLGKVIEILFANILSIVLLFLPFLVFLIFHKKINFQKLNGKGKLVSFVLACLCYTFFLGFLMDDTQSTYSPYQLYFKLENNALNKETFGAIPSVFIEIRKMLFPSQETILIENKEEQEEKPVIYEKNILDLPLKELLENEKDATLKKMHEYFLNDEGTTKNSYTGSLKGKNLILIMAESFNSIAVNETITPTLYKLTHEGFVFENFYSPVILSTIGGEFQELTGLYPNLTMLSNVWREGKNAYPFGYGKVFEKENYQVQAYHNHKYYFQNRDVYLKSLGFQKYEGCFNGLEKKINCTEWPESDVEMISSTMDDYMKKDTPFFTYYVTVSGHMSYNFTGNDMAIKNKDAVKGLPYSEDILAYLASQVELDKALKLLIDGLEERGLLQNTVIALVGDHYPYDISLDHINEIAPEKKDETIEVNRSHFILWNPTIEKTTISKVGGNMDVLPTILNLFGISYDSRLIMGRDLLSPEPGLVLFSDGSWVSDYGVFYASTKKFVTKGDIPVSEEYVTKMNQTVSNRINLSKLILEKDYYRKVLGE